MNFNFQSKAGAPSALPRLGGVILAHLDKLPDGELLDTVSLANAVKRSQAQTIEVARHSLVAPYRHLIKGKAWHGNKRTIAELRKKFP